MEPTGFPGSGSSRSGGFGGRGGTGRRRAGQQGSSLPELHGRLPPSDIEAEKAVLSAILLDNNAFHNIVTELGRDDFYHPAHQTIYGAMEALKDDNQPVDLTTLADHLNRQKLLDAVGGAVTLAEIADYEATPANIVHYAHIVRDKAIKRNLISTASEIVSLGFDQAEDADQLLDAAESKIFALSQARAASTVSSLSDEMHRAMDHVEQLMAHSDDLTGLAAGYPDLDKMTGGLQKGDLVILAARPSMGKTALALNIARNAAVQERAKVMVFSLEMTARALVLRMLSAEAKIDSSAFRTGFISNTDYQNLSTAAADLAGAQIFIDDSSSLSILEIRARCRRQHARTGLDLVILDYMQLARGDTRLDSREQEISEVSRGLKSLAKELDIPVIALSQLNRGPETRREDKRPMLSDLRESGAIEQDADVIGFIYRDFVYNDQADPGAAELLIRKQRNGPTGTVDLFFQGRYALFTSLSHRDADVSRQPSPGSADAEEPF